jgi:hypothetical protein
MNTWLIVLTSSAVGVLVSGVMTLVGQRLERRSRREELLLTKAVEIAAHRFDSSLKFALETKTPMNLMDAAINVETDYRWLKSVLETGKLPPDADKGRLPKQAQ